MTKPILLLRLEGPLQSWGERSRWDVRDTSALPTKSGIIGLLGCALGYGRSDPRLTEELDAGLAFGVRIENPGELLEDFQTITGFLPMAKGGFKHRGGSSDNEYDPTKHARFNPATIISPRVYLEDAAFLVALAETENAPENLVRRCADAIKSPKWPIFLGRKSCAPTRPIFDELSTAYENLEEALQKHPWSWLGACRRERIRSRHSLAGEIEDTDGTSSRQDRTKNNAARIYGYRNVRRLSNLGAPEKGSIG